jgi:ubiquinone/menaquinone biosynthesis C-methylase UbiE
MRPKRHIAAEKKSLDEVLGSLPKRKNFVRILFSRLARVAKVPPGGRVLDVGAAAGEFIAACAQLGYDCAGVEPWEEARQNAGGLSQELAIQLQIVNGTAESIPFADEEFDVIHAMSVMEHVVDIDKALSEACRVLKPGGVFWFYTASAMCPIQGEIRRFPLFGWYPDSLKRKIMNWAKGARPELIGYTETPAINWFTPWKARRLLRKHGFSRVYDRWELRGADEGGWLHAAGLKILRSVKPVRILADVMVQDCSYAAVK